IVFEVFEKEKRNLGALAGGGRYDILPEIFGRRDMGATGVAGGVERTILALSGADEAGVKAKRVFVGYVGEDLAGAAAGIASTLRRGGVPADLEVSGRSLRKQLEYASKSASLFVIVGPRDYAEREVTLRDMRSGVETKIPLEELEARIRSSL
ncbi:MAG: His/Gly/Thr/Pro-type tRNA ligase C-terminal domain-containing protein, partial [Candidatus Bathyarchaeia archaeon]